MSSFKISQTSWDFPKEGACSSPVFSPATAHSLVSEPSTAPDRLLSLPASRSSTRMMPPHRPATEEKKHDPATLVAHQERTVVNQSKPSEKSTQTCFKLIWLVHEHDENQYYSCPHPMHRWGFRACTNAMAFPDSFRTEVLIYYTHMHTWCFEHCDSPRLRVL